MDRLVKKDIANNENNKRLSTFFLVHENADGISYAVQRNDTYFSIPLFGISCQIFLFSALANPVTGGKVHMKRASGRAPAAVVWYRPRLGRHTSIVGGGPPRAKPRASTPATPDSDYTTAGSLLHRMAHGPGGTRVGLVPSPRSGPPASRAGHTTGPRPARLG